MTHRTRIARPPGRTRAAFTLVELLVVVTVLLVIMAILAQGVTIMTNTIRDVKAQGDFVGSERAVMEVLRRDLQYDHFLDEDGKPNGGRKLRDQRTDQMFVYDATPSAATRSWKIGGYTPPKFGYFAARADTTGSTFNVDEGLDSDFFQSSRSGNHFLQFTAILPGGAPGGTFAADVPFDNPASPTYPIHGTCVEIAYFLEDNGTTPGGTKKYKLIRRQRLAARGDDDRLGYENLINASGAKHDDVPEVVAAKPRTPRGAPTAQFDMFDLKGLTLANNRLIRESIAPRGPVAAYRVGEDVLNYNVTSFEVKFKGTSAAALTTPRAVAAPTPTWPTPFANGNTDYPYDTLPYDGQYDTFHSQTGWDGESNLAGSPTGSSASPLKRIRITGALIKLRYWNPSTKSTRQTTIAVDL